MANNGEITECGNILLRAYVALKAGEQRRAFKLFASLKNETGIDPIMDGVAKGMIRLQAMEEDDMEDYDTEYDDMEDDTEYDDTEDDDTEDDDTEEDMEASVDKNYIEVPASVAKYLELK